MLDKDKAKTTIKLDCGCEISHTCYFVSGFQSKSANEFIMEHYRINPHIDTIDHLFMTDHESIEKIKDQSTIERLCEDHFSQFFMSMYEATKEFFKEDMK